MGKPRHLRGGPDPPTLHTLQTAPTYATGVEPFFKSLGVQAKKIVIVQAT